MSRQITSNPPLHSPPPPVPTTTHFKKHVVPASHRYLAVERPASPAPAITTVGFPSRGRGSFAISSDSCSAICFFLGGWVLVWGVDLGGIVDARRGSGRAVCAPYIYKWDGSMNQQL